jgi:hypothetical protein
MTTPNLAGTIRYRWIDGSSIRFFAGKGEPRRLVRADSSNQGALQKVIELEASLYKRASEGHTTKLGDFITIRWLSRTNEFRFYLDKKVRFTIAQDGETAEFREALEAVYAESVEEAA